MFSNASRQSKVWAITSFYTFDDPPGVSRRLTAYRQFRQRLRTPLVAVELSSDGAFQLEPGDAEILIQLDGGALLWQKERLLNLALDALPAVCDTVAWIDCDVAFEREDWPEATRALLNEYMLVQPFRYLHYLAEGEAPERLRSAGPEESRECVVALWLRDELPAKIFSTQGVSLRFRYTPGMAWAARRSTLEKHPFYDAMIMGSADKAIFSAACGRHEDVPVAYRMSEPQERHFLSWARPFFDTVGGRLGYLEGDAYHFWHGALVSRGYHDRYQQFDRLGFCPTTDLRHSENRVWRWSSEKPELHEAVRVWFDRRKGLAAAAPSGRPR